MNPIDITQALPLLGGISPQTFMKRHWQRKPRLIRQAIPGFQLPVDRQRGAMGGEKATRPGGGEAEQHEGHREARHHDPGDRGREQQARRWLNQPSTSRLSTGWRPGELKPLPCTMRTQRRSSC